MSSLKVLFYDGIFCAWLVVFRAWFFVVSCGSKVWQSWKADTTSEVWSGLWPGEIQQDYIGALLFSFENDFMAVRGDVEVVNIEV